ncbi:MAG: MBL fold metallo-hydrolase [Desulfobacterales bacterium]|nr:MAG: MBL fold metallo-hydrolase [Desulfobacterales bacterium]
MTSVMELKFWGVRGSIPSPGPKTVKYGGNTLCLELRLKTADDDRLIIIDAGSGIRELGDALIANYYGQGIFSAEIFLTHTHLDHILGLPFFAPMYLPQTHLKIHGPITCEEERLKDVIGGQMSYRYFPVRQEELGACIEYIDIKEGRYDLGDGIMLIAKYLNHPLLALGYRFEYLGKVFCTAYDTEPFYNVFSMDPTDPSYDELVVGEGEDAAREENRRMEDFFYGADLLVHDGQYVMTEYEAGKMGWGHSPVEWAVETAERAAVKRLAICHYDPLRTDSQIDELARVYCGGQRNGGMEIVFAREGMVLEV